MKKFNFLCIAPCSFVVGNKSYNLAAGQTISLTGFAAERVRNTSFRYHHHLRLISTEGVDEVKEEVKEVKEEPAAPKPPVKKAKAKTKKKEVKEEPKPKVFEVEVEVEPTVSTAPAFVEKVPPEAEEREARRKKFEEGLKAKLQSEVND